jgi:hypothetical protein
MAFVTRVPVRAQTPKTAAVATGRMASQGDPRVLSALNVLFSFVFSALVVWGLDVVGLGEFSWTTVAIATLVLFVITWVVVLRR